jgi:hypothetical protein
MSDQTRKVEVEEKHSHKVEPPAIKAPYGEVAEEVVGPASPFRIDPDSQISLLRHLHGAQRKAMAQRIGRVQGNRHLQHVIGSLRRDRADEHDVEGGNGQVGPSPVDEARPEQVIGEVSLATSTDDRSEQAVEAAETGEESVEASAEEDPGNATFVEAVQDSAVSPDEETETNTPALDQAESEVETGAGADRDMAPIEMLSPEPLQPEPIAHDQAQVSAEASQVSLEIEEGEQSQEIVESALNVLLHSFEGPPSPPEVNQAKNAMSTAPLFPVADGGAVVASSPAGFVEVDKVAASTRSTAGETEAASEAATLPHQDSLDGENVAATFEPRAFGAEAEQAAGAQEPSVTNLALDARPVEEQAPQDTVQAKLVVDTAGDAYEQEADQVADAVMASGASRSVAIQKKSAPRIQRNVFQDAAEAAKAAARAALAGIRSRANAKKSQLPRDANSRGVPLKERSITEGVNLRDRATGEGAGLQDRATSEGNALQDQGSVEGANLWSQFTSEGAGLEEQAGSHATSLDGQAEGDGGALKDQAAVEGATLRDYATAEGFALWDRSTVEGQSLLDAANAQVFGFQDRASADGDALKQQGAEAEAELQDDSSVLQGKADVAAVKVENELEMGILDLQAGVQADVGAVQGEWGTFEAHASSRMSEIADQAGALYSSLKDKAATRAPGAMEEIKAAWDAFVGQNSSILGDIEGGWEVIWQQAGEAQEQFIQKSNDLLTGGAGMAQDVLATVQDGWATLQTKAGGLLDGLKAAATSIGDDFWEVVKAGWNGLKDTAKSAWTGLKNVGSSAWQAARDTASSAWQGLKSTGTAAWQGLKGTATSAWQGLKSAGTAAWQGLKGTATSAWTGLKATGTNAWQGLKDSATSAWQGLKNTGSSAWNGLKNTSNAVADAFHGVVESASKDINGSGGVMQWFGDIVRSLASGVRSVGTSAWNGLKDTGKSAWQGLKSTGTAAWQGLKSTGTAAWQGLKSTGTAAWQGLKGTGTAAWQGLKDVGTSAWQGLKSTASSAWQGLKNTGTAAWQLAKNVGGKVWEGLKTVGRGVKRLAGWCWDKVQAGWKRIKPVLNWIIDRIPYARQVLNTLAGWAHTAWEWVQDNWQRLLRFATDAFWPTIRNLINKLTGKEGQLNYQTFQGRPVIGLIHPNDVQQMGLGDCYFLSSLATIADQHPEIIQNMIQDNGDGTYTISLYDVRNPLAIWDPKFAPVQVTVTADFPVDRLGRPLFAQSGDVDPATGDVELWVMLLEKAYAEHYGGYYNIEGGWGGTTMEALTGIESETYAPTTVEIDQLAAYHDGGYGITVNSFTDLEESLKIDLPLIDMHPDNPYYDPGSPEVTGNPDVTEEIIPNHAYYITDVDEAAGTVTIKNPHGWWDDAARTVVWEATIPYEDFQQAFAAVEVNPLTTTP